MSAKWLTDIMATSTTKLTPNYFGWRSTDFPTWLKKPETQEQLKGKEILMYCTGGVRCEMASKLLKKEMKIEDNVFQLQGGIENYFKEFEDGGFWNGSNFVFDKREAFSVESGPAGVGGVVKKKKKEKKKSEGERAKRASFLVDEHPRDGSYNG